jgi:hypothetical protein
LRSMNPKTPPIAASANATAAVTIAAWTAGARLALVVPIVIAVVRICRGPDN